MISIYDVISAIEKEHNDKYSTYDEGWSDCCARLEQMLYGKKLVCVEETSQIERDVAVSQSVANKFMTDIEAKKAFNLLIDYCNKQPQCDGCLFDYQDGCVKECIMTLSLDCKHKFNIPDEKISHPIDNPITHPAHYTDGNIEVWDFIADKKLSFFSGNVIKYVCRAGKKDPNKRIEDLKKARAYIDKQIELWECEEK